jgi:hypothetical protein
VLEGRQDLSETHERVWTKDNSYKIFIKTYENILNIPIAVVF